MKVQKNQIAVIGFCLGIFSNLDSQEQSSVFLQKDILGMKTEGIAFLGSGMNEDDAKTFAINDAKRNALEQAGTYLESHTTVLNYKLIKDEVITFSAGLLKVKVLKEERTTINNMFTFKVNILAAIDMKILSQRIAEIKKDSGLREQLEAERVKVNQLEAKIADLQTSSSTAPKQIVKNVLNELSAVDWFDKGFNTKDNNIKIDYYNNAIQLDPQYIEAFNNRGLAYYDLVNYYEAIQDYSKAIELNPQAVEAYANRGVAFNKLGKYDEAFRDYNKAIELDPQYVDAYINRGIFFKDRGNYNAALRDYNKAIELNPHDFDAYVDRGNAFCGQGNYYEAIRDYSKAIELNPQAVKAYYNRGTTYTDQGKYEEAIRDYNKAIELIPQYVDAYINRGNAYYRQGNHNAAIRDYNKAIELNPQAGDAYHNRGTIYREQDNYDMAIQDYTKVIEINPQDYKAYYLRGLTYGMLNNNEAAANDFNYFLRIHGDKDGNAEKVRQILRSLGYTPQY
jgi:tetratricopeptide (TPR) repeat protein